MQQISTHIGDRERIYFEASKQLVISRPGEEDVTMVTEYDQSGDNLVFGNDAGLELLHDREDLKTRMARLEKQMKENTEKMKAHDEKMKDYDVQFATLREEMRAMTLSCESLQKIRLRLFATFRRDFMQQEPRYKVIETGNPVAHHGDAVADANIVMDGVSKDAEIIRIVYGRTYGDILQLDRTKDSETIAILNKRATLVLEYSKAPAAIETAFQKYLTELDVDSGSKPKDNNTSQLSQLHTQFWAECQKFRKDE
ncbi:hypothetical protein FQN50_008095 [Emmonsiellopsis sp. PD_5]|nr:hypothetical protein FQN50_008095 [Emmonsiellopsis sp. PD_5]